MYLTAEVLVCLQARGIDDDNCVVGRVRRAHGLSNDNRGVGGRRGIDNASNGLKKTAKAVAARQRAQRIYDNEGGVGEGR